MPDNPYANLEKYLWLIAEGPRLGAQIADTLINLQEYEKIEPGTGVNPTMVIPGFTAGNSSTFFLRKSLMQKGHNMVKWWQNRNHGFSEEVIQGTIDQVKRLANDSGETVNIVGQSLGGCFARTVANAIPDHVNVVVTLGSPLSGIDKVAENTINNYNSIAGMVDAALIHHDYYFDTFYPNPPVPSSSLYSKTDGVVFWEHSIVEDSDLSENIEIDTSHFGMGFHLITLQILANRLNQDPKNWKKWDKSSI